MRCRNCGRTLEETDKFCPYCGRRIEKRSGGLIICLFGAVALALAVFGIAMLLGMNLTGGHSGGSESKTSSPAVTATPTAEATPELSAQTTPIPTVIPTAVPASVPAAPAAPDYIFPDSSSRYLTDVEIHKLDVYHMYIARNEIFARKGRRFSNGDLCQYFAAKAWYSPVYDPGDFDAQADTLLNDCEKANVNAIYAAEEQLDSPYLETEEADDADDADETVYTEDLEDIFRSSVDYIELELQGLKSDEIESILGAPISQEDWYISEYAAPNLFDGSGTLKVIYSENHAKDIIWETDGTVSYEWTTALGYLDNIYGPHIEKTEDGQFMESWDFWAGSSGRPACEIQLIEAPDGFSDNAYQIKWIAGQ